MRKNEMAVRHDPDSGQYGDCWRTCLSCLLDLEVEEVPHFVQEHPHDMEAVDRLTREWLNARGLDFACVPINGANITTEADRAAVAGWLGPNPYVLVGKSPNFPGVSHAVVGRGAFEVVWDPAPSRMGLEGPCDDGIYWVYFLVHRSEVPA